MTASVRNASGAVRVGCVFRPQFAPERIAGTAKAADNAGLDELWLWEDCFLAGGISGAAIALSNSTQLTVGIGVLPAPMRNVALTAMEIATLARAFPGRVRIGLGHGVQDWMAQVGARVASPMTLLREHLTCLNALLLGKTVTFHGRYVNLDEVALDWTPDTGIEVLAAAMGPRTLQLSGELAAGTVITGGTTPAALQEAITQIRMGRGRRDNRGASTPHSIVTYVLCTTGPRAQQVLAEEIEHWGFDPHGQVGVYGDAAAIATDLKPWLDAGTDTVVLQPPACSVIEKFVEFVGFDVRSRLVRSSAQINVH